VRVGFSHIAIRRVRDGEPSVALARPASTVFKQATKRLRIAEANHKIGIAQQVFVASRAMVGFMMLEVVE
jgi:hypothetical protein